jgi:hypothetical protein
MLLFVLTLVIRLVAFNGNICNGIPRIVNTNEQEQKRDSTNDKQCGSMRDKFCFYPLFKAGNTS